MVNTNIQAKIVLEGAGLRHKDYGNYKPGEYRQLSNVELGADGVLRTRRSIVQPVQGADSYSNALRFVGSVDNFSWAATSTALIPVGEYAYSGALPDSPSNLPDQADSNYHHVVGFFKYNNTYYWLTANYDGVNVKFYIYSNSSISATFATMAATRTLIGTVKAQGPDPEANQDSFKSYFIFKDRLFLVTHETVYFSKATDPMTWAVPWGGFFKIPDQEINACVAVNDSVFLATNQGIHVFSYSIDPNKDGYMKPIADDVGAWAMTVNEGVVYASNKYSLYTISHLGITRAIDFADVVPHRDGIRNRLISFENYVLVIEYRTKNVAGEAYPLNVSRRVSTEEPNTLISFNTKTGSAHRIDFEDYVSLSEGLRGRIVDALVSKPNYDDDPTLVLMTSRIDGSNYSNCFYLMDYPKGEANGIDQIRDSLGTQYVKINQQVEIDSYAPDGNEILMKKYRGVYGMAKLPTHDFEYAVAYDNHPESRTYDLLGNVIEGDIPRPHHPFRLPMNQRGRSVTLKFRTKNPDIIYATEPNSHWFELSDLRLFWTFTKLAPRTRSYSD